LRTNLTTRALAALFDTSQSTVDRVIDHLVRVLVRALTPRLDHHRVPWIIDGTPTPVDDRSITAVARHMIAHLLTGRTSFSATGRPGHPHHHHTPARSHRPHHPRPALASPPTHPSPR